MIKTDYIAFSYMFSPQQQKLQSFNQKFFAFKYLYNI